MRWHHDVGEHEIDRAALFGNYCQRFRSTGRAENAIALPLERRLSWCVRPYRLRQPESFFRSGLRANRSVTLDFDDTLLDSG